MRQTQQVPIHLIKGETINAEQAAATKGCIDSASGAAWRCADSNDGDEGHSVDLVVDSSSCGKGGAGVWFECILSGGDDVIVCEVGHDRAGCWGVCRGLWRCPLSCELYMPIQGQKKEGQKTNSVPMVPVSGHSKPERTFKINFVFNVFSALFLNSP